MKARVLLLLAVVVLLITVALPSPEIPPAQPTAHASSAMAAIGADGWSGLDAGELGARTAKFVKVTEHRLTKAHKRLETYQDRLATRQGVLDLRSDELAQAQTNLSSCEQALQLADAELSDAHALPKATAQEQAARATAIERAQSEYKACKVAHSKAQAAVTSLDKAVSRLVKAVAHLALRCDRATSTIAQLEAALAALGDEFVFAPVEQQVVSAFVHDAQGTPIPFAHLSVVEPLAPAGKLPLEALTSPGVHWQGFTGSDGRASGTATLPGGTSPVDVIVTVTGWHGEYTHESLRATWGPFAPAARFLVDRPGLLELDILLTEELP